MSLQSVISEDRRRMLHDEDEYFTEPVLYGFASGGSQELYVHVVYSEIVELDDDGMSARQVERIAVAILRDPYATFTPAGGSPVALGGIERPQVGDTISRNTTHDVSAAPYSWKGETVGRKRHSATYLFERYRQTEQGVS